ncbi:MAG: class I SAM-dependent rRNA methyltransferase [Planctomycetales bacterium]|nr:class I SAM-dependent rRNA methyltransferase [Planctomycetales bacterium]
MPLELRLAPADAAILRRGHPWLFHGPRYAALRRARPGDVVDLLDATGRFLARGLTDPDPPIGVRVFTRDEGEVFGPELLARRFAAARDLRARLLDLSGTTAYRLVNGEGDALPGLLADLLGAEDGSGAWATLQLHTRAWQPHMDAVVEAIRASAPLEGVLVRERLRGGAGGPAEREGGEGAVRLASGRRPPDGLVVRENGLRFLGALDGGARPGLFLDQRENRRIVRERARGADVLNAFAYTGGFSVAAAAGGAARTTSVDVSKRAHEAARRNLELNGLDPHAHRFFPDDVFEFLGREARRGNVYDIVILDPPSLATGKKGVWSAVTGYRKLAAAAARVTKPGGLLAASSSTGHVTGDQFWEALRDGAADAGASLRAVEWRSLPPDHPVPVGFPEGRYLKFVLAVRD